MGQRRAVAPAHAIAAAVVASQCAAPRADAVAAVAVDAVADVAVSVDKKTSSLSVHIKPEQNTAKVVSRHAGISHLHLFPRVPTV